MDIKFELGVFGGVFAVPNCIADEHIKICTAAHLKVMLYCLRHSGQDLSVGEVSRATGIASDDVTSAFEFWRQRLGFSAIHNTAIPADEASGIAVSAVGEPAEVLVLPFASKTKLLESDYEFSPKEITALIEDDSDIAYLFRRAEDLYGRPLKTNELKALTVSVAEVGIKPEVALVMLEYCFTVDKTSPYYIKTTAKDWVGCGIDDFKSAQAYSEHLIECTKVESEFVRRTQIQKLPDSQRAKLNKWSFDYKFSIDVIYDAYQITLEKTGKLEYKYLDKILTTWNKYGIGAEAPEKERYSNTRNFSVQKNKAQDTESPATFDLNELERQILGQYTPKK
jgi:DnaD/phage-associated family protein